MKKLYILCDHGLGNRIGSILVGLKSAEYLNLEPIICWPVNNWCGAEFNELFDSKIPLTSQDYAVRLVNQIHDQQLPFFFISTIEDGIISNKTNEHSIDSLNLYQNIDQDIICSAAKLPKSYNIDIERYLKMLGISKNIKNIVNDFSKKHQLDTSVTGIHIRKTDAPNQIDENEIYHEIKNNPTIRYFICSDDESVEKKFKSLSNVIMFPKTTYVKKLEENTEWRQNITGDDGRNVLFNMDRPKQSIIEGFVDMLLLSKTAINRRSKSTFRAMAEKYQGLI